MPPYAFDGKAQRIEGAATSLDAKPLRTGRTYRDTLKKDGKVYYRLDLDTRRNAYVSVVAVPKPGGRVAYGDGFKVGIQDNSGADCGYQDVDFGSAKYARPLVGYARRTVDPDAYSCQKPGAYYVLVERDSAPESTPDDWELEIRYVTEPLLTQAGPRRSRGLAVGHARAAVRGPAEAPGRRRVPGGRLLREGEWRADLRPGQTLFYRVPVDWGQQLFAGAELGSGTEGDLVSNALTLSLANPALGFVDTSTVGYDGRPATVALDPLRPVAHENRTSYDTATNGMRFAGWYYLSATLSPELAAQYGDKPVPLTLRVNVRGTPRKAPAYDAAPGRSR
ncbi:hypothetical protein O1L60_18950 [Streptomyces diastatochromogenes]|nr:hypothetical protein [Streptomyces diastatochromogenes]